MSSPSENMFKVQESFSAPKTPKFSAWYRGLQRILQEVQDEYGLRIETADFLCKEAKEYGEDIREKLKNLQRF